MKDINQRVFQKIFGFDPYPFQKEVFENLNNQRYPLLIKAPTGSGKTEGILASFLAQFLENRFYIAPRLIYVLPMRVLVNSTAQRIKKYVEKISPLISVKIQHGDVPDAPFFIADVVITTLDQFVYGFARASQQVGHHIDMPAGAIASSLVVFDEAHMYRDEFTFSIMKAIMEILYESKIPFVVMTATMPESLEKSLFENIDIKDKKIIGRDVINSKLQIKIWDEPLYANNKGNIDDVLLRKIKKKKTLIVLNQVKRAQKVYEEIKKRLGLSEKHIVLLHSRLTKKDREKHENTALSLIPHKEEGKIKIPKEAGIVVSTQVLEAGIDFSAELLLTEVAPADCLVQRAGRCARYEGEEGEMIIFPVDDEKGYKPYEMEHLERTINWINENPKFNIKKFEEVCSFVNILDYQANDFEARDTLVDLYECVLYADTKPENIQVRNSKPAYLIVLEINEEREKILEERLNKNVDEIKENSLEVDIKFIWWLFERSKKMERPIKWEIKWAYDEKAKKNKLYVYNLFGKDKREAQEEDRRIRPFGVYILDKHYYNSEKGVVIDECWII
jgi:CRISPR-associated endonuclease/helicase Cas3